MIHDLMFRVWLIVQTGAVFLILVAFVRRTKLWRNIAVAVVLFGFVLGGLVLAGGTA